MSSWLLAYEGFDPAKEGLREALCTLGNGYFATRGAAAEADADDIHYPGTYLAGGYNRLQTQIAGRTIENEDLVNLPNWLPLKFRLSGEDWFAAKAAAMLDYRQELDMHRGILLRAFRYRDRRGRVTRVRQRRLVHMGAPHLAAFETIITAENWSGRLELQSALDGRIRNRGVKRYAKLSNQHLQPMDACLSEEDTMYLKMQTCQSEMRVAVAVKTRIYQEEKILPCARDTVLETDFIAQTAFLDMKEGEEVSVEKTAALFTSRDNALSECGTSAKKIVSEAGSFHEMLQSHSSVWGHLWRRFDIQTEKKREQVNGHDRMTMILHLHLFHLLQTTSIHTMDLDVGVPARGWHGEAYRGHIFWDELFIFPLLNLRLPNVTRALLVYRYRRLPEARRAAQSEGYKGAMYPWQSGSSGREESQQLHLNPESGRWNPDNSRLQRHVNGAIAYNIWRYWQVTRDCEFLAFYGAEMMLEIARFWASIAAYNPELDRYEIKGVMGPDEYHDRYPGADQPGLNNNAYTNVMAVWCICRALDVLEALDVERNEELCCLIDLKEEEIAHWREVSRKMRIVSHGNGIISQFEGYDQLREFDWDRYRAKYGDIRRLDRILEMEGDSPNRYQVSKQADVLMLFYLFSAEELRLLFHRVGYDFDGECIPRNIEYYLRRTSDGSTLSKIVHSWVLARSDRPRSWSLFNEALESDISDIQGGTTPEGIHLGAMAGSVDYLQRGATGIETRDDILWLNPCLPEEIKKIRMKIRYRGFSMNLEVKPDKITIHTLPCREPAVFIGFRDRIYSMSGDETLDLVPESSGMLA